MKAIRANATPWIVGSVLAFGGVALARLVAPHFQSTLRILATLGGQLLALGGLFVICLGVRRRTRRAPEL